MECAIAGCVAELKFITTTNACFTGISAGMVPRFTRGQPEFTGGNGARSIARAGCLRKSKINGIARTDTDVNGLVIAGERVVSRRQVGSNGRNC